MKKMNHDVSSLSKTLLEVFDEAVGHAIIFTSVIKRDQVAKKAEEKSKYKL